ncbi:MAG: carbohydrate porin [Burkholderiales bacterium]|nr:carbohydrate porin [Burkholderiales bacterium]
MLRYTLSACAFAAALHAQPLRAASNQDLDNIRTEIRNMRDAYESRITALEKRLAETESKAQSVETRATEAQILSPPTVASASGFNPAMSLILSGTYANLQRDPDTYQITGFIPSGGEVGPPKRSFSLAESELVMSANIDPYWRGDFTLALDPDNAVAVEEAAIQSLALPKGLTLKAGRFFSGIGYTNEQHAHAWDFVDAPLAQKAFLGKQYSHDGVQLKWLAPTETFLELGVEVGRGHRFPGSERNQNGLGSYAAFAHAGGDVGASHSWRGGLSFLHNRPQAREFKEGEITNSFSGRSGLWLADFVWKWAPEGNARQTNFKFQTEYYRRSERGELTYNTSAPVTDIYRSQQSGGYAQAVYQFQPRWRVGARYDRLEHGSLNLGSAINPANLPVLAAHNPARSTLMLDYSSSEFSRWRLQIARDVSRLGQTDNQLMLQYVMSLGAHGAHKF